MITEQGYARLRGVLRRRRLPIVAVTVGTLAVSAIAIGRLEPRYRATAIVRALESQPAKEYVAPTVNEQMGERLKTLRLALMARPLLAEVAEKQHLVPAGADVDPIVDRMRAGIEVKVEGEDSFLLTYEDGDPQRAKEIVNAVADRFMTEQVKQRNEMARATESALEQEAASLRPAVEALESKVRDFKLAHYGSLPEQQEQNLRTLDQTTMEINIQATNLDLENERRRQLINAAISPLRHQEEQLLTALNTARTRYTPEHPEVKHIESQYESVKAMREGEEKDLRRRQRSNNPELSALEGEIRRSESTLAALKQRESEVRQRVSDTAKNGQELARLVADHEAAQGKYLGIVSRLREAELAARIEHGLSGLRYELVEGAVVPRAPVKPNRPLLGLGALLLAALLGLAVGFALDRADTRVYSPAELVSLSRPVDVLACVPELPEQPPASKSEERRLPN